MSRSLSFATFLFFFIALPFFALAAPVPTLVHRMGGKNHPVGGAIRPQDWHMEGDMVHAHGSKGLSMNTIHPGAPTDPKKQKVWTLNEEKMKNHQHFALVHDGGKDNGNGGVHPEGHVSLIYHGKEPMHKDTLKEHLKNLPWERRSYDDFEDALYRRSVEAEKFYRRELLEKAYRRALLEIDELD
ncbi:hypothetical protein CVT26_011156 [Gymnopilus dilepis]|uniref:Uncharacterized protein n=1 Tax=Gymnopilus dilepis TaxID=231916 RepID=A0A409VJA4_9AGAR|nr:hypothetical protein CVT26_011156 [Gymnopilus dilepis]